GAAAQPARRAPAGRWTGALGQRAGPARAAAARTGVCQEPPVGGVWRGPHAIARQPARGAATGAVAGVTLRRRANIAFCLQGDNVENKKYRLVTRSDFDGLVCAVLLNELDLIDDITFVHPKDMQDGKIAITER